MKKLLSVLGSLAIVSSSASSIVSCANNDSHIMSADQNYDWSNNFLKIQLLKINNKKITLPINDLSKVANIAMSDVEKQLENILGISNPKDSTIGDYAVKGDLKSFENIKLSTDANKLSGYDDGYLEFNVVNKKTGSNIEFNGLKTFNVRFTAEGITNDVLSSHSDVKIIGYAMAQTDKVIDLDSSGSNLSPFSDLFNKTLSSLGSLIGPVLGNLGIPQVAIDAIIKSLSQVKNLLSIPTQALDIAIKDLMQGVDNTFIDIIPTSIPNINSAGVIEDKNWDAFITKMKSIIKSLSPGFDIDSELKISFPDPLSEDTLNITTTVHQILDGLAPDIVHFANFIKDKVNDGEENLSLLLIQYLSSNIKDINDKFSTVNKDYYPETMKKFLSSNLESIINDLMGWTDVAPSSGNGTIAPSDVHGWSYNSQKLAKSAITIISIDQQSKQSGVCYFTYEGILNMAGSLGIGDTIAEIFNNILGNALKIDDISNFVFLDAFDLSADFTSLWKGEFNNYLAVNGLNTNNYSIDITPSGTAKNSSIFEVYNGEWQKVNNVPDVSGSSLLSTSKFTFADVDKDNVIDWRVNAVLSKVVITNNITKAQYNYENVSLNLPLM